jgi:hypothetical protein
MSKELSLLNTSLPAHLRGGIDETTKALMGNAVSTTSVKRISIKGSVFRMMVAGKEVAQNEDRAMPVVIVAAAPHNSRTFYDATYSEDAVVKTPTCYSDDGIIPNTKSLDTQSKSCKDCPQNIDGSASSGKGRACRYSRRLAVVLENDQKGDVFQLTLPAQSIFGKGENGKMPLESYVRLLGSNNVSVTSVVTEMRFDTASATPKLTFKALRYLEEDEFINSQEKGKTQEAKTAIGSTAADLDTPKLTAPKPVAKKETPVAEEATEEPVKRPTKKESVEQPKDINAVLDDWA